MTRKQGLYREYVKYPMCILCTLALVLLPDGVGLTRWGKALTRLYDLPEAVNILKGYRGIIALSRHRSALFKRFVCVGWNSG